jgi:ankyrin repeat protein
MVQDEVKVENFQTFSEKIKKIEAEKFEELIFHKNRSGKTFLHFCIENYEQNFEILKSVFNFIQKVLDEEKQKDLIKIKDCDGRNILHKATFQDEKALKFTFNFIVKLFNPQELQELFHEKNRDGNNFLHLAAKFAKSKENFEFLWSKIFEIVEEPKEFFMQKEKYGRNVLQRLAWNESDP